MARRSLLLPFLLLICSLAGPVQAVETRQPTHEFTLDNGLKVIVREDHRAPVVVSQLWYRVGSSYEPPGRTGMSHALEHMMFKGSERLEPGQASRLLSSLGAQENAFTSRDYTAYYQILSRDQLAIALELEAERMHGLTLPEDEFLREMEVIKEERRLRVDDNPNSLAYERFLTQAYMASPYGQPVIGWMHDLDRLTVDDLRNWYHQHYQPSNAILVVVGDVQADEVRTLAERYFGPLTDTPATPAKAPRELPGGSERSLTLHLPVQMPSLLLGFNVPSLSTAEQAWEAHALRLLEAVLDGGYSARLPSRLERDQAIATSASASYDGFARGDSLFLLSGLPNESRDTSLEQLEQALWEQIDQLKQTPPSQDELNRVQAQMTAELVYAQDSISHQANQIGMLESIGLPWTLLDEDVAALQAITPEQISEVARRYLVPERLTRAHVLPVTTEETR
ncbi:putative zinc protease [Pseudomonas saudimassiliensis]|uniref:Putative zinc protease n=1 Tax=Pseudomonas saudimassiliensis TaxID=1461581 RepID=A0A078MDN6_9PSED|nr:pitrilysin family protein [Pseudomonas saudimassiliensis]CEA04375.1 putative zinc protease [Pseudomonas saudimassiliensis]CEF26571.1 putative zinc protease [Pseudomonas saudimassiliensis]